MAEYLQEQVNVLTEIKTKMNSWGGTGGKAVTRIYLCGPTSPFQAVVFRLEQTLQEVYKSIANGELNLT